MNFFYTLLNSVLVIQNTHSVGVKRATSISGDYGLKIWRRRFQICDRVRLSKGIVVRPSAWFKLNSFKFLILQITLWPV
jgi:hypothetical protein